METILTHSDLAKLFKGGFVFSLIQKAEFDRGIDQYIMPSVINDIQTRVMRVRGDGADLSVVKNELSAYIKEAFWNYLNSDLIFETFRSAACAKITAIFEKRYDRMSYGKAQKVVNMIFKYLYCFEGADQMEDRFIDCHMPLDSKILDWYRSNVDKTQKTAWSNLAAEEYDAIQMKISQYIREKYASYSVLQAEFVIWDREINKV